MSETKHNKSKFNEIKHTEGEINETKIRHTEGEINETKYKETKTEHKWIVILSFTRRGCRLNTTLGAALSEMGYTCENYAPLRLAVEHDLKALEKDVKGFIGVRWGDCSFVFIGAAGIAIRYIAPWVSDKFRDSAVISMDEKGEYVIPLLSGHVGGAVELAREIAGCVKGVPVITTATDIQNKFAVDVFAKENHLHIGNKRLAKEISAAILEGGTVGFYSTLPVQGELPEGLCLCKNVEELCKRQLGIAVSQDLIDGPGILCLTPQSLAAGIGCKRGTSREALEERLTKVLADLGASVRQIRAFASIDLKKDEPGMRELAKAYGVPFITYSAEELRDVQAVSCGSEFVAKITGVDNVCERAARKYFTDGEMILPKKKLCGVTLAIVREHSSGVNFKHTIK